MLDTRAPGLTVDGRSSGGGPLNTGSVTVVKVGGRGNIPASASAATLNVTVVDARAPGYATIYPCGTTPPNASNLNFTAGQTIPNAVITKLAANGTVCIYTSQPAHFLVDTTGAFGAA